jgi:hypothetical protein
MSDRPGVRVTVLTPAVSENGVARTGACQLLVESTRPLPRASYSGTARVGGVERTTTGSYPCRLLKHFTVARVSDAPGGGIYTVSVDLADEGPATGAAYAAPGLGVRRPDEPIEVICKRIAGVFGRYCEEFRPPSVIVELGE